MVTALKVRAHNPNRAAVYIDGDFAFDLELDVVKQAGLEVGRLLDEEAQEALLHEDQPYRARSRALRLLEARGRTAREVERRLLTAGFADEVVAEVILWLSDLGYLNDERYAAAYAAEKR
ncbi:MAG: RecX family transcriptional regulator, partial [Thermoleophilia bacterium]|nr:RecX family transcriptional regulator [Thermoleophilia bacterium]